MRWLPILIIKAYRALVSPIMPNSCRYTPTCSTYAVEAYRVHGAIKGTALTCLRILRCHPWSPHGYDPVPPRGAWRHPERHVRRG